MRRVFGWGHVVQTAVWPFFIVFNPPRLDHFLGVAPVGEVGMGRDVPHLVRLRERFVVLPPVGMN